MNTLTEDINELWAHVCAVYESDHLLMLTNPHDRTATEISNLIGHDASKSVIVLWRAYFDDHYRDSQLNREIAARAVVALMWERAGFTDKPRMEDVFRGVTTTTPKPRREA